MLAGNGNLFLVALGANLGATQAQNLRMLRRAIAALSAMDDLHIRAVSGFYATPCFPPGAGPDFVNACISIEGGIGAAAMLARLHRVEAVFGRERSTRWAARVLDLDLLAMGDAILPDAPTQREWMDLPADAQAQTAPQTLILPHPRLHERAFVLVPLADIAVDWVHPVLGESVLALYARLEPDEIAGICPI
jgi:2-amino-4-hydroxy-6-hydroxymethyldihydropteridine diphosphokinase